jgi:hypothetical protein
MSQAINRKGDIPGSIMTEDELKQKIHNAFSQMRLLTPKEQEARKRELARLEKELGHDGFQDYLLEWAGLK